MELPESSARGEPSPTRRELQGPRPPRLQVRKDSYKIKKPPVAPPPAQPPRPPPPQQATAAQDRQPVIIYAVSPKVIHTTVSDFMNLVQRLTGSSSSSGDPAAAAAASSSGGDLSPAARLASIERTSPKEREKEREIAVDLMGMVEGVEVGQIPGILSPATLQPIPPGFFSPGSDPHALSFLHDLSPFMHGIGNNMFIPSPSTLFSAPIVSPSPSSFDLFNQFLDF